VRHVTGLVGVYHAEGNLWGELSYWVGARLGRAHCALCDITHGTFRRKRSWDACQQELVVPFTTWHLDDRPDDVRAASEGHTPCVLARTEDNALVVIVGPDELNRCGGDPAALVDALMEGVSHAGLRLPG
jgi:hypothetical protein